MAVDILLYDPVHGMRRSWELRRGADLLSLFDGANGDDGNEG